MTRPRAVLIGPPGAGKSTIAVLLAQRLGVDVHDTDAAVVESTGRTISDIFFEDGEPAFRALERDAVAEALRSQTGVVALGGGAPIDATTRGLLADHIVVFLDVGIADASKRIGFGASRPLLSINPRASWIAMMNERRPVYEALATITVDTSGREPEHIVDEIVDRLTQVSV